MDAVKMKQHGKEKYRAFVRSSNVEMCVCNTDLLTGFIQVKQVDLGSACKHASTQHASTPAILRMVTSWLGLSYITSSV